VKSSLENLISGEKSSNEELEPVKYLLNGMWCTANYVAGEYGLYSSAKKMYEDIPRIRYIPTELK